MSRKTYTGPIIDVSFDRSICQHAAECVKGMQEVFNPKQRPWINPTKADTDTSANTLRQVVARCPSGALRVIEHG